MKWSQSSHPPPARIVGNLAILGMLIILKLRLGTKMRLGCICHHNRCNPRRQKACDYFICHAKRISRGAATTRSITLGRVFAWHKAFGSFEGGNHSPKQHRWRRSVIAHWGNLPTSNPCMCIYNFVCSCNWYFKPPRFQSTRQQFNSRECQGVIPCFARSHLPHRVLLQSHIWAHGAVFYRAKDGVERCTCWIDAEW